MQMNKGVWLLSLITVLSVGGCATINETISSIKGDGDSSAANDTESKKTAATTKKKVAEKPKQDIPSSSKFSKVKMGMGSTQVKDLIGQPSDTRSGSTGKAWIPFYYGSDRTRTTYYYKGEGRISFSYGYGGGDKVVGIDYDPSEDGYR